MSFTVLVTQGSQNGFTLELAANQFRGKSDGNDSLWSNTQVEAGRQVHLESGADTRLQGAVIASNEQAVQDRLNRLETGTLMVRDVENRSDYKAGSSGVVASIGFGVGEANKEAMAQTNQDKSYRPDLTGSAVSKISGSDSSVTRSGISQAEIVITDLKTQQELTGQGCDSFAGQTQ